MENFNIRKWLMRGAVKGLFSSIPLIVASILIISFLGVAGFQFLLVGIVLVMAYRISDLMDRTFDKKWKDQEMPK